MRILVFGAGVLGSLFAARLHDAGHDVTILARGERLASIREHGIVVRDEAADITSTSLVPAVERLEPDDRYDAILAFVRREQRLDALPALVANSSPTVVFMGNDASGAADLRSALGDRLVLGFGMAGGTIEDGVVHARVARTTSPTVLGEPDGTRSERVRELATVLASAGIRTTVTPSIDAWLRTHAAVVVPVAEAVYAAGGDVRRLGATPDLLLLTIRAVRETLAVLRASGIPVTPAVYGRILALPEGLLAAGLARAFATDAADLMTARHAMHAREEMAALDADLARMAEPTGLETPSLDRLRAWLDPAQAPMEEGSRTLVAAHPVRAAAVTTASAAAGIALVLVVLRRTRPDLVSGPTVERLRALSGPTVERLRDLSGIDARIQAAEGLAADLPSRAVLLGRLPSRRSVLPLVVAAARSIRPRLAAAAGGATEAMRGARSRPRPMRRLGLPAVALVLPIAVAGAVGLLLASPRRAIGTRPPGQPLETPSEG